MEDPFDEMLTGLIEASTGASDLLTRLASSPIETLVETPSVKARLDKQFFPPLPGRLFARLVVLPEKALGVYMILRLRSRLEGRQTVVLTSSFVAQFGLDRRDKKHALTCLERHKLIVVEQQPGKNPRVTLRAEDVPWVKP